MIAATCIEALDAAIEAQGLLIALFPDEEKRINEMMHPLYEPGPGEPPKPKKPPFPMEEYEERNIQWIGAQIAAYMGRVAPIRVKPLLAAVEFLKERIKADQASAWWRWPGHAKRRYLQFKRDFLYRLGRRSGSADQEKPNASNAADRLETD